jgi:protein O-mannosyl-transferase
LITFAIEFQFFGLSPYVSHFINVLLFAVAVFFLFLLLSKLFKGFNPLFAFIITLLFSAHPIHTEVVDNIKSRDELLSFLNTIAMLYFLLRYSENKKAGFLVAGLLLFYLALMSKESAIMGIVLIPFVLWFSGEKSLLVLAKGTFPFLLMMMLFFIQKNMLFETKNPVIPIDPVNYPYTAEAIKYSSAFMLFLFFLKILAFPLPLRYEYSYNQIPAVGWDSLFALLGFLTFMGILVYTIIEVRKRSRIGFALGFFYITLFPPLAFIMTRGGVFAERLLFFPSLGFCILVALFLEKVTGSDFTHPITTRMESYKGYFFLAPMIIVVVVLYSFKTIDRNKAWSDRLSLFGTDIKTGKNSFQNQLHYGSYWLRLAQVENDSGMRARYLSNGLTALHQAVSILPGSGDALYWIGFAYEIRASAHPDIKTIDSAMYYYKYSVERAPDQYMSYYHLANLYEWIGRFDVASYFYNRAFEINPEYLPVSEKVREMKVKRGLDVRTNPLIGIKGF